MPQSLLIVDGHRGVREALAERLCRAPGVGPVAAVSTLEDARQHMQTRRPAVVLCDPKTLVEADTEVVRQLSRTGVPVVVLTASLQEGDEEALRRAGASAVLLQGLPISALLGALEQSLI